ncbi:hypothetical protein C3K47_19345, partial [Solitalea longa]
GATAPGNVATFTSTVAGAYSVVITNTATGCVSLSASGTVTVNPLPTATIAGTRTVCLNATAPDITFTGANGTAPYTFTYTINGGVPLAVTTTSGSSVTVSVATGTAGSYAYDLVSVQDASGTTCSNAQTGTATVTVLPPVTYTYVFTNVVCKDDATKAGAIDVTPAGGSGKYILTLKQGSLVIATGTQTGTAVFRFPNLLRGSYTVEVEDANYGCPGTCNGLTTP